MNVTSDEGRLGRPYAPFFTTRLDLPKSWESTVNSCSEPIRSGGGAFVGAFKVLAFAHF